MVCEVPIVSLVSVDAFISINFGTLVTVTLSSPVCSVPVNFKFVYYAI